MWWLWLICAATVLAVLGIVCQDWWLPSRRRIGYEEMRRSIRDLKNAQFDTDDTAGR